MRSALVACISLAAMSIVSAEAREWKFTDGTVLEAELVSSNSTCVTLKAASEAMASYPLSTLAREDRIFTRQQAAQQVHPPAPLATTADLKWFFTYFNDVATPLLRVELTSQGSILANAGRTGDLQIETLETDATAPPKLPSFWNRLAGELDNADRGADVYPYCLRFSINCDFEGQNVTRIRRLKGSYQFEAGERHTLVVKNIAKAKDLVLDDPILKQLQLKMIANAQDSPDVPEPETGTQCFSLDIFGRLGKVIDVSWTDSEGSPLKDVESGGGTSGGPEPNESTESYYCKFESPVPDDLELRITLLTNPREERVPFDFADLEVPPRPPAPAPIHSVSPTASDETVSPSAPPAAARATKAHVVTKNVATSKRNRRRFK